VSEFEVLFHPDNPLISQFSYTLSVQMADRCHALSNDVIKKCKNIYIS